MDIFVARQPVFTAAKKIFGYELLFRSGLENAFPDIDGDTATSNVLANTFFSFGLDRILGQRPGLINFTRELILEKTPLLFPREHIIIEVLENIEPEPEIIDVLKSLKNKGFRIALDDFVYGDKFRPLMDLCDMIKFDITVTPLASLEDLVRELKTQPRITLLAEKVETHHEFEQAKAMGFRLFQGYFFSKPEILSKKEISAHEMTKLRLIREAALAEPDLAAMESLIKKDVSLSFKLLKFINSAYFHRKAPIDTIKEALLVLGIDELKKFISVAVVSDLNQEKPNELIRSSVIRARMCELTGGYMKTGFTGDELFTIGLFSFMDAILDMAMDDILEQISLSEKLKGALLGQDKGISQLFALVNGFEKGNWDHPMVQVLKGRKILNKLPGFYMDAVWMADAIFI